MSLRRRGILGALLAATGLALYLWPALAGPVVVNSDSVIDLELAREGLGILSPAPVPRHPPKPAYLLFLRTLTPVGPEASFPRRIVVVQSVLVWLGIALASWRLARHAGPGPAVILYVLLLGLLRLRDVCSVVMPEALAIAISLPLAAFLLDPPRRAAGGTLLGAVAAILFLVRPNLGATTFLLLIASFFLTGRVRALLAPTLAFAAVLLPFWILTRTSDPLRGLSTPLAMGSRDYSWDPNPSGPVDTTGERREIRDNWTALLGGEGPDRARLLVWRLGHGLLGTDFYDARWNAGYAALTRTSRLATPVLILIAAAVLIAAPRGDPARFLGLLLGLLAIAQGFVLGALPRYGLPFLPPILLYAAASLSRRWNLRRVLFGAAAFAVLVAATAAHRYVLDQEWGVLEAAGVRITQPIARGALPRTSPATLHLRVGRPVWPSAAELEILGPGRRRLYASSEGSGDAAYLTIPLPVLLIEENRNRAVELELVTSGAYGPNHFWLYPVVPPFWAPSARREASAILSPATGLDRGSLDWWAHEGAP